MTGCSLLATWLGLLWLSVPALGAPPASAQIPSLATLLADLPSTHPQLRAATARLQYAGGRLLEAHGTFDPTLSYQNRWVPAGFYPYFQQELRLSQQLPVLGVRAFALWRQALWPQERSLPPYIGGLYTGHKGLLGAGIEIPLYKNLLIDTPRAQLQIQREEQQIATLEVRKILLQLRVEALSAYWKLAASSAQLAVEEQLLQIALQRKENIGAAVAHGDLPAIEAQENERSVLLRSGRVLHAQRQVRSSAAALSLYLRDAAGLPIVLPGLPQLPLPVISTALFATDYEADVAEAMAQRPEAQTLQIRQRIATLQNKLARNQLAPDLWAALQANRDLVDDKTTRAKITASLQFSLPLPLRTARGKHSQARAEVARLEAEQLQLAQSTATKLTQLQLDLQALLQRIILLKDEVRTAQAVEDAERQRFELGDSTLFITNLREQVTADTQLRLIAETTDYLITAGRYWAECGRLTSLPEPRG